MSGYGLENLLKTYPQIFFLEDFIFFFFKADKHDTRKKMSS